MVEQIKKIFGPGSQPQIRCQRSWVVDAVAYVYRPGGARVCIDIVPNSFRLVKVETELYVNPKSLYAEYKAVSQSYASQLVVQLPTCRLTSPVTTAAGVGEVGGVVGAPVSSQM